MSVYIKQGVCGNYSRPIAWALGRLHARCRKVFLDLIITSIGEGNHGAGSVHYLKPSNAVDFVPALVCKKVVWEKEWEGSAPIYPTLDELKEVVSKGRFGGMFDLVATKAGCFHIEYDPKEKP